MTPTHAYWILLQQARQERGEDWYQRYMTEGAAKARKQFAVFIAIYNIVLYTLLVYQATH